jgi:hypothetical protein
MIVAEFDPHPALRATLSQWQRESRQGYPSPNGRRWREAPGEGRTRQQNYALQISRAE